MLSYTIFTEEIIVFRREERFTVSLAGISPLIILETNYLNLISILKFCFLEDLNVISLEAGFESGLLEEYSGNNSLTSQIVTNLSQVGISGIAVTQHVLTSQLLIVLHVAVWYTDRREHWSTSSL